MANIKLTKEQQQYIVCAVLFLGGGGYAFFRYFWLPVSARITETQRKIEEVEGKVQKAQAQAARLPRIQKELEVLNQQALEAEKRLPKDKDVPAVIDTLSALAQRSGVQLLSLASGGASQKQYFIELPYTISMKGGFHETGKFLAALALEQRIFNVRGVTYGAPDAQGRLSVNFTLVAYQYKG